MTTNQDSKILSVMHTNLHGRKQPQRTMKVFLFVHIW